MPGPLEQQPFGQVVALQMQPVPAALQVVPVGQVPQEPPQPLGPQTLPVQSGWQAQVPPLHDVPAWQQMPLQHCVVQLVPGTPFVLLSYLQVFEPHLGVLHVWLFGQSPLTQQLPVTHLPLQQTLPEPQSALAAHWAQQVVALAQSRSLTVPSGRMVPQSSAVEKLTWKSKFRAPVKLAPKRQALPKFVCETSAFWKFAPAGRRCRSWPC